MASIYNDQNRKNSKSLNLKILLIVKVQNYKSHNRIKERNFHFFKNVVQY